MDRRTFVKGVTAAGILAAVPAMAAEPAHDPRNVIWIANGNGWRQVHSLLAVKKGDIFCMSWPVPERALSDGFIAPHDKRAVDSIYAESFCSGGPSVYPPYPYCNRCKDWRIVPEDETADVEDKLRKVCDPCIADPTRAERKYEAYREYFRLHPLANL